MSKKGHREVEVRGPARGLPGAKEGRLLLGVKSVPESRFARREPGALECEASVLTTELTAPIHSYLPRKPSFVK